MENWLEKNFGSQASQVDEGGNAAIANSVADHSSIGQNDEDAQENRLSEVDESYQMGEASHHSDSGLDYQDLQHSYSFASQAYPGQSIHSIKPKWSAGSGSCYLINNKKSEVVLSGIPSSTVRMTPSRIWASMVELHHKPLWSPASIYISLPNIYQEFGLKNRVGFNVQNVPSLPQLGMHRNNGIDSFADEKDNMCDDNLDSISVTHEKIERREQALRDAARGMCILQQIYHRIDSLPRR